MFTVGPAFYCPEERVLPHVILQTPCDTAGTVPIYGDITPDVSYFNNPVVWTTPYTLFGAYSGCFGAGASEITNNVDSGFRIPYRPEFDFRDKVFSLEQRLYSYFTGGSGGVFNPGNVGPQIIFSFGSWILYLLGGNIILQVGGVDIWVGPSFYSVTDAWHHVFMQRDGGGDVQIGVDGVVYTVTTLNVPNTTGSFVYIGGLQTIFSAFTLRFWIIEETRWAVDNTFYPSSGTYTVPTAAHPIPTF